MHFNDISIRQLSFLDSGQVKYGDDTLPGFGLIVGKRIKTFFVMHGKQWQTKIIGTYLDLYLKDARQEAKRILSGRPQLNSTSSLADTTEIFRISSHDAVTEDIYDAAAVKLGSEQWNLMSQFTMWACQWYVAFRHLCAISPLYCEKLTPIIEKEFAN